MITIENKPKTAKQSLCGPQTETSIIRNQYLILNLLWKIESSILIVKIINFNLIYIPILFDNEVFW